MKKTCIIVVGPTAVGKTSFAIKLAQHYNTQIISADSRQCYKELGVAVAKPSLEELKAVKHWFIDSHSIHDTVNAAVFEQYALDKVAEIFTENDVAIMVGGTGLYVKTFCEGIDEVPAVLPHIREDIAIEYEANGLTWLQQQIEQHDLLYYNNSKEINNPQRLMRALEVKLSTGKSILEYQTQQKIIRDFDIIKIGLELPREQLYNNINQRVDIMVKEGLIDDAKSLESYKNINALQTVGYRELFDYFEQKIDLPTAINLIKQNSRHYAKRQLTWFKKDTTINWVASSASADFIEYLP